MMNRAVNFFNSQPVPPLSRPSRASQARKPIRRGRSRSSWRPALAGRRT